jgi:hypothetical protein
MPIVGPRVEIIPYNPYGVKIALTTLPIYADFLRQVIAQLGFEFIARSMGFGCGVADTLSD